MLKNRTNGAIFPLFKAFLLRTNFTSRPRLREIENHKVWKHKFSVMLQKNTQIYVSIICVFLFTFHLNLLLWNSPTLNPKKFSAFSMWRTKAGLVPSKDDTKKRWKFLVFKAYGFRFPSAFSQHSFGYPLRVQFVHSETFFPSSIKRGFKNLHPLLCGWFKRPTDLL